MGARTSRITFAPPFRFALATTTVARPHQDFPVARDHSPLCVPKVMVQFAPWRLDSESIGYPPKRDEWDERDQRPPASAGRSDGPFPIAKTPVIPLQSAWSPVGRKLIRAAPLAMRVGIKKKERPGDCGANRRAKARPTGRIDGGKKRKSDRPRHRRCRWVVAVAATDNPPSFAHLQRGVRVCLLQTTKCHVRQPYPIAPSNRSTARSFRPPPSIPTRWTLMRIGRPTRTP